MIEELNRIGPKRQKKETPLQTKGSSYESLGSKGKPKLLTELTEATEERDVKIKKVSPSAASGEPPRRRKVKAEAEEPWKNSCTWDNSWSWRSSSWTKKSWQLDPDEPPKHKKRSKHGKPSPEKVESLAERTVAVSHAEQRDVRNAQEYARDAGLCHRAGKRLPENAAQTMMREVGKRRREEASSTADSDRSRKKGTRAADGR